MEKEQDLLDSWVKSQNDFFDTWMKSQENFVTNWTDSMATSQKSLKDATEAHNLLGADRYYPEYLNWLYSPSTMSDEFIKNQKLLKTAFQKQMDIFKEMAKLTINSFPKTVK